MNDQEKLLNDQLTRIQEKIQWLADAEARAAWIKGAAANGSLMKEKLRLLDQAEDVLKRLEAAGNG